MFNKYLEGIVERITFYSEETGYTVMRLHPTKSHLGQPGKDGLITVVGTLPELQPGESVQLSGIWKNHRDYGSQFHAESLKQILPATEEGIRRYLGSGLIKGIGPSTAKRIVDYFGLQTLTILDNSPDQMIEVAGVGKKRVERIKEGWRLQQHIREVMFFLQGHKISTGLAVKIYKFYGDKAIEQVQTNPYHLARDVEGIGFKTADKIAQNLGLLPDAPERIQAGIVYTLNTLSNDGHVYSPRPLVIENAAELLEVSHEGCDKAIKQLQENGEIILDKLKDRSELIIDAVYTPALYHSEQGTTRLLLNKVNCSSPPAMQQTPDWNKIFAELVHDGLVLNQEQEAAVHAAITAKFSILTGGPGTGKTTTLKAIVRVLQHLDAKFELASPTGRAAKRLSEATGQAASTIHRLLGFNPSEGYKYNMNNPLDVDLLIVDEASMLDIVLFYNLLKAVKPETHLVLVGDIDQLPSVGPGDVLHDLIRSGIPHITRLSSIYRQSESSLIVLNAHRINQGQMLDLNNKGSDFFLFSESEPEKVAELITDIVQQRLPKKFGLHPLNDVQILTPMHRGPVGVQALNEKLQNSLNPSGKLGEQRIGGRVFRVGDKVMQIVNNYQREVYNGDLGFIEIIDHRDHLLHIRVDNRLIEYDWIDVDELVHAYAISVHRSQGTEYPAVVIPMLTQHYMLLQRNLLYTAITRAKQVVVLVGTVKAIAIAVKNDSVNHRYSGLAARLKQ